MAEGGRAGERDGREGGRKREILTLIQRLPLLTYEKGLELSNSMCS